MLTTQADRFSPEEVLPHSFFFSIKSKRAGTSGLVAALLNHRVTSLNHVELQHQWRFVLKHRCLVLACRPFFQKSQSCSNSFLVVFFLTPGLDTLRIYNKDQLSIRHHYSHLIINPTAAAAACLWLEREVMSEGTSLYSLFILFNSLWLCLKLPWQL